MSSPERKQSLVLTQGKGWPPIVFCTDGRVCRSALECAPGQVATTDSYARTEDSVRGLLEPKLYAKEMLDIPKKLRRIRSQSSQQNLGWLDLVCEAHHQKRNELMRRIHDSAQIDFLE